MGEEPGDGGVGRGQEDRASCGGSKGMKARPPTLMPQPPFVFTLRLKAVAGQAKGAGPQREGEMGEAGQSPAALECQASRSPAAARLLAPARSQEQPGSCSLGSGNASRHPPPTPPLPAPRNWPVRLPFFGNHGPKSWPFPTGHPHSASSQQPFLSRLPKAVPPLSPSLPSPPSL